MPLPSLPAWACDGGIDRFGAWADFAVERSVRRLLLRRKVREEQRMRWIEPGEFYMGSPSSEEGREEAEWLHRVVLSTGFWVAATACTQGLWEVVMGENPSAASFRGPERPVHNVSWHDCSEFLTRLGGQVRGLTPALPTEAQWEYACRAGSTTPFSFGARASSDLVNCAWGGAAPQAVVAVRSLPPNAWGLYEMHGNVREWCRDDLGDYPAESHVDPVNVEDGPEAVYRGGGWDSPPAQCRSAARGGSERSTRNPGIGFRIAGLPVWSEN